MSAALVEKIAATLGPKRDAMPMEIKDANKVVVTVTEHDLGWLIVAEPDRTAKPHSRQFVGAVARGTKNADAIEELALRILKSY